jgi:hypothetical protein
VTTFAVNPPGHALVIFDVYNVVFVRQMKYNMFLLAVHLYATDGQTRVDVTDLVDESRALIGQLIGASWSGFCLDVVPLLAEPVVARHGIVHTYDPATAVLALHLRVVWDLVEVEVEEHPRRNGSLLGRLKVGEVMYVDGVLAADVAPVLV